MWLRHGKPKECSHFLRLANKKEKNVNEGTKISKVSFFLTAAVLKCSTSNPFPYNQNIASLLQLHIPIKGNIERRKKCFLGCLKYYRKVSLEKCLSLFQFQWSLPTPPSKPLSRAQWLRTSQQPRALWLSLSSASAWQDSACKTSQHILIHFFSPDSTSRYKQHPVPLGPESNGWRKPMGIFRSWSLVLPTNVR